MKRIFLITLLYACLCFPGEARADAATTTWWSLRPLEIPAVPAGSHATPIDAFIAEKLASRGLAFSAAAEKRHWLRRVYFDLIGLPPSPAQLEKFLEDDSPNATERVVDALLASPRYGERWARHWMDVARYAETHGHDEDAIREHAWPYRDWLIRSLNSDKPYAEFVREQIAGDVIAPDDPWATAATGFLGCGPWDESSQMGIQDGTTDKKIAQYLDRDDLITATMSTFTSTTVHCARCHDHKFDPVSLEDYYSLQAVFAGVDKVDRPFEPDRDLSRKRRELKETLRQLTEGELPESLLLEQNFDRWITTLRHQANQWQVLAPKQVTAESSFEIQPDGSILFNGEAPAKDTCTVAANIPTNRVTAIQLEVLTDATLPANGPGRAGNGNFHLNDVTVRIDGIKVRINRAVADFNQSGWEIDRAIDDNPDSAWGIDPEEGKPHRAVFVLAEPVQGNVIEVVLAQTHGRQHVIGRPRLLVSAREAPALEPPLSPEISEALANSHLPESRRKLGLTFLELDTKRQLAELPPEGMVYAVASHFEAKGNFKPANGVRDVHVLRRGDVHSPIATATPGALSCLPELPGRFASAVNEGQRRAALANWIAHPDNSLTWRSIVNRVWHYHFGRGLVASPNDFGTMGALPTHPALLDWLAVEFRNRGGSMKWLHKTIILSHTYGQSAKDRADAFAADPDNLLLWRSPRRRLDAESIRDATLALSGRLDFTMGGPSSRHFHSSKGVHVTPVLDYRGFDPDDPASLRRGVYRFVFRTVPDPLMQALDCPDASQLAPRRETSTTALQALALLNNRFLVRQSEHIASSLPGDLESRVSQLFLRAYGRQPDPDELTSVTDYARKHGLANTCRIILNSSEFLFTQ